MKILPLAETPIRGLLGDAYMTSIVLTKEQNYAWFYSNYIQLYCGHGYNGDLVPRIKNYNGFNILGKVGYPNNNPLIRYNILEKSLVNQNVPDIQSFLINCLDKNKYIFSMVDEFYVPNTGAYQKYHFLHANCVYGYDQEGVYSKVYNSKREYSSTYIPIDAYICSLFVPEAQEEEYKYIYLMELLSGTIFNHELSRFDHYEFDIDYVREQFEDYLQARNSSERYRIFNNPAIDGKAHYGMAVYKQLINYYSITLETKEARSLSIAIRDMHVLWEHKKVLRSRVEYMEQNGYLAPNRILSDMCIEIELEALVLRNIALKFEASENFEHLVNIIERLNKLAERDAVTIELLLKCIEK